MTIRHPKTAMVLAAGLGTRMRPLTDDTPKPLIRVAGKALIDYTLDQFADAGVQNAVVNVHYLADQIETHLKGRKQPNILISDERERLLETGGGVKKARPLLGEAPVFVSNTDAILLNDDGPSACTRLAESFDQERDDALLQLVPKEKTSGYDGLGDVHLDDLGRVSFRNGDEPAPFVFTGLQILNPRTVDKGPEGPFSLRITWKDAIDQQRLRGIVHSGRWMHVGDPAGLKAAEEIISLDKPAQS
ncbi:MAG: nucleotidyltransferase family protein [Pseudomonadota bacterium]